VLNITNPEKLIGSSITVNGGVPIQCISSDYNDTEYTFEFRRDDGDDRWEITILRSGHRGGYMLECRYISKFGVYGAMPEFQILDKKDVGNEQTILREIYNLIKAIGR
jgi:hypothetical protein